MNCSYLNEFIGTQNAYLAWLLAIEAKTYYNSLTPICSKRYHMCLGMMRILMSSGYHLLITLPFESSLILKVTTDLPIFREAIHGKNILLSFGAHLWAAILSCGNQFLFCNGQYNSSVDITQKGNFSVPVNSGNLTLPLVLFCRLINKW